MENLHNEEKQMTAINLAGASSALTSWLAIDWKAVEGNVRKLQVRIAKESSEKKYGKVKSLQWILTHSMSAKLLAIKRVTSNKGKDTVGVDHETWRSDRQKLNAVSKIKRHGYKST